MYIYEMMARLGIEPGRRSITAIELAVCNGDASMRILSI
jgi:hypothetical protein